MTTRAMQVIRFFEDDPELADTHFEWMTPAAFNRKVHLNMTQEVDGIRVIELVDPGMWTRWGITAPVEAPRPGEVFATWYPASVEKTWFVSLSAGHLVEVTEALDDDEFGDMLEVWKRKILLFEEIYTANPDASVTRVLDELNRRVLEQPVLLGTIDRIWPKVSVL